MGFIIENIRKVILQKYTNKYFINWEVFYIKIH